jgi:hypothetical protein
VLTDVCVSLEEKDSPGFGPRWRGPRLSWKKKDEQISSISREIMSFVSKTEWIFLSCSRIRRRIRVQEKSRPLIVAMALPPTARHYPRRHPPRPTPNGYLVVGCLHPSFGHASERGHRADRSHVLYSLRPEQMKTRSRSKSEEKVKSRWP